MLWIPFYWNIEIVIFSPLFHFLTAVLCMMCASESPQSEPSAGVRHDLKSWLIAWSSACWMDEGQKRATSAIDRKTLERADTIAINNQVEYNLRIRKKRKRKNERTLSNHPALFFYGSVTWTQRTARICCSWRRQHKKMIIKSLLCAV
jgi:hypothetical protein